MSIQRSQSLQTFAFTTLLELNQPLSDTEKIDKIYQVLTMTLMALMELTQAVREEQLIRQSTGGPASVRGGRP